MYERANASGWGLTTPCVGNAICNAAKAENPWFMGHFAEMGLPTTAAGQVLGKGGFASSADYQAGAAPTIECTAQHNLTMHACRLETPADAYACMKEYFHCLVNTTYCSGSGCPVPQQTPEKNPIVSMLAHQLWHHHTLAWGLDMPNSHRVQAVGSEVGENIDSIQVHIAFTRGAAKQFDVPWFVDFSDWYTGQLHGYVEWPNGSMISSGNCGTPYCDARNHGECYPESSNTRKKSQ